MTRPAASSPPPPRILPSINGVAAALGSRRNAVSRLVKLGRGFVAVGGHPGRIRHNGLASLTDSRTGKWPAEPIGMARLHPNPRS